GEKVLLLAALSGLLDLPLARVLLDVGTPGIPTGALLVAPLFLHAFTASIAALGARRGRGPWLAALAVAMLVHAGYNALVLRGVAP
ncbi:MAG: PrsW family intramembrane metalloprotease, partial [Methanobacteriota archaeon]